MKMKKKKKTKRKTVLYILLGVLLTALFVAGGFALYGRQQMKKIPSMSAQDTLDYILKDNQNAVLSIGIWENGKASSMVYGADGKVLDTIDHTYEIGSITKTMTAALACRAVQEGKLSLSAPLNAYLPLPEQSTLPTIASLITHTSGYKGYYLDWQMVKNHMKGRNEFYGIGDSRILEQLNKTSINDVSHPFLYSNFGYAALGLVLENVYQTEFSTLLHQFIQDELGLQHTQLYNTQGDLGHYWDWMPGDTYMAAGALTSNLSDMLKYASYLLSDAPLAKACLQPIKQIDAANPTNEMMGIHMDEIAYGWMVDNEHQIIWHNGATGHYNSYLGLDPTHQRAVVVLSNLSPNERIPATILGLKLLLEAR